MVSRMIQQKKQYQSPAETIQACAEYVSDILSTDKQVLLFFSGGSSLQVMPYLSHVLQQQIIFCAVDERFDVFHSNFISLQKEYSDFYHNALAAGCRFIDTSPHQQNQYEMAEWLEQKIRTQLTTCDLQLVTLLGMGEDGHIAGILPFPEDEQLFNALFVDTNRFVVGYDATGKNQHAKRFTLTFKGLDLSHQIVLFAAGEKKQAVMKDVEGHDYSLYQKPVKYLFETTVPVTAFTSSL